MQLSERGVNLEQGEAITLRASATTAAVVGATGTAVATLGERLIYTFVLDVTAAATDVADTLDVYIDTLFGTATWVNVAHFTQVLGNGGAKTFFTCLVSASMTTTDDVSTDCAAGVARGVVGSQFRARWTMVDADVDGNFTWSLTGYAI